jgi:subtilase family serine protease
MSHSLWTWLLAPVSSRQKSPKRQKGRPQLEQLEARDVPATAVAHPDFVLLPSTHVSPFGGPGGFGYSPSQIKQAYGINQISFNGVAGDGSGTTIAIVDAYDDPTMANDLHQFDVAFGLPDPTFTKINEFGTSSLPRGDTGWAQETSLDVEWAHAIAPKASILLVEANSATYGDLLTAVQTAAGRSGVVAVSMSWGGGEFSGETSYDSYFKTPSGHGGVTFLASSGDAGAPASFPATSPSVVAVGGTTSSLDSAGNILSESGWSGSGGGISTQELEPTYQKGVVTQTTTRRANPDVAYDADPNTGFPVYNSYSFPSSPWQQFGGTSDAAPQWAAIIAIADQGRALNGLGSLDGATQTLPKLYSLSSADFHDITSGTSAGSPRYSAATGYDLVTGRGTPVANKLVADLVGSSNTNPSVTHFSVSAPISTIAGAAFSVTVTALDAGNNVVTGYLGTVTFTSSDSAAILPGSYPFTSVDQGVHVFAVTLKTAGSQSVTVADTFASSVNGSATVSVSAANASKLAFVQQPTSTTAGAVINPAVTVQVLDPYGNLETGDSTDQVTLAFGNNPGGATLGGTTTVMVMSGVATFANLTVSTAGTGYTLTAISGTGTLAGATSNSFNISTSGGGGGGGGGSGNLIEGFETSDNWYYTGSGNDTAYLNPAAAHDGSYGLDLAGPDWFYRTDSGATVNAGDTLSAWVQFSGSADGRAYLGFGSTAFGTLSLVAAPNTNQFILQSNSGYVYYTNLAAGFQTYQANHWYRLEVDWSTTGAIVGKLFDSNGTTLLRSISTRVTSVTTGGIAVRSIGSDKYWDTITDNRGVNSFSRNAIAPVPVQTAPSTTSWSALESAIAAYLAAHRSTFTASWGWW